jgi:hypothetical protein
MFIIAEGNEELSVGKDLNSMKGGSWAVTLRLHLIYHKKILFLFFFFFLEVILTSAFVL